jgi:hypothetical protein
MGIDHLERLFAAASAAFGAGHPFALDFAIGVVYGVGIGLALVQLRSGIR